MVKEACDECGGRDGPCSKCRPAPPDSGPEPKPPGCRGCRVKERQIDQLLDVLTAMVGAGRAEAPAKEPLGPADVCAKCDTPLGYERKVTDLGTGATLCVACFADYRRERATRGHLDGEGLQVETTAADGYRDGRFCSTCGKPWDGTYRHGECLVCRPCRAKDLGPWREGLTSMVITDSALGGLHCSRCGTQIQDGPFCDGCAKVASVGHCNWCGESCTVASAGNGYITCGDCRAKGVGLGTLGPGAVPVPDVMPGAVFCSGCGTALVVSDNGPRCPDCPMPQPQPR